jgi:hypothetical protein
VSDSVVVDRKRVSQLQERMIKALGEDWQDDQRPLEMMAAALELAAIFVPAYSLHEKAGITEEAFVSTARRYYRHQRETWGKGKGKGPSS